ncbi:DUF3572 domain-containing protein [Salinarimonas ramus]|uniref:DUF3572 family protein n=1 Tax=Salinarimonas ramus TaxID=690164 RepID=A0A917QJ73_9HYPH|nr:DUF3572 domain-containing protein [Salinarimonas ramus]GGK53436.1 hypothetical protein GCM10011322_45330 [Salinarimonas ramus]
MNPARAEEIAVAALGLIAADEERLARFLALTGLDPAGLREAAGEPGFLAAILDHVVAEEELLLAVAEASDESPEAVARAQMLLSPPAFDA